MKRIGLIGGMSWQSSALYYELINEFVSERLGGFHSADCVMVSIDFAEMERMQHSGNWDAAADLLSREAALLESAGAELIVLCTNTMHKVADAIEAAVSVPFLHLADVTATAVRGAGIDTVGLLGTRFTMQEDFYRERLQSHGLTIVLPTADDMGTVDRIIYEELVGGTVLDSSRASYLVVIADLQSRGAQGVILGCTEIELLISQSDTALPVFPTTRLHALAAVEAALA